MRLIIQNVGLIVQVFRLVALVFKTLADVSHRNGLGTGVLVMAVPAVAIIRLSLQVVEVQVAVDPAVGHVSMLARQRCRHMGVHAGGRVVSAPMAIVARARIAIYERR
jgi:hypothetical protein